MRVSVSGKELKQAITVCKLKGKYNEGLGSSNSLLCDDVILECKNNKLYVHNADNFTYVVYRLDCEEDNYEAGIFAISGGTLSKYLTDTNVTIKTVENKVEVLFGDSIVSIPILARHSNASVITRLKEYLMDLTKNVASKAIRNDSSLQVTPKLHLSTIIKVCSEEFSEAMSLAEKVGNSIYNLNYDEDSLIVSSNRDNEKVTTEILPITQSGECATVDISLPVANVSKIEDTIVLAYGDDVPVVFINNKVTILRGPRDR